MSGPHSIQRLRVLRGCSATVWILWKCHNRRSLVPFPEGLRLQESVVHGASSSAWPFRSSHAAFPDRRASLGLLRPHISLLVPVKQAANEPISKCNSKLHQNPRPWSAEPCDRV